jgi:type I restriction enzyme M protein
MNATGDMRAAFDAFDTIYSTLSTIDSAWYKKTLNVIAYGNEAPARGTAGTFSEEYVRARFVYALIASGKYKSEHLCVEVALPKGNGGKSINPDILAFKDATWVGHKPSTSEFRQNILAVFEAKRDAKKDAKNIIEKQLRTSMNEAEGDPASDINFVFGVYFDSQPNVIIFKKENNHPIKRYSPEKIRKDDPWNLGNRDAVNDLPDHAELMTRAESMKKKENMSVANLDPIDEDAFSDLLEPLNRAKDRAGVSEYVHALIVEFLTYKVYDEKHSTENGTPLRFFITRKEIETADIQKFRKRFKSLQDNARKDYPNILTDPIFKYNNVGSNLQPNHKAMEEFLIEVIHVFEMKSILKAKNENFNQIIFNNFGSSVDKALDKQFFTPIPAARMMVDLVNPLKEETIVDPCSGICDFLAVAFRKMHNVNGDVQGNPDAKNLFGFDKDTKVLKLAELNLVLNGDGGASIKPMNSLTQKMCDDGSILAEGQFTIDNYDCETWEPKAKVPELKKFDVAITNPPFGRGRDLSLGKKGKWDVAEKTAMMYETYWLKTVEMDIASGKVPRVSELKAANGKAKAGAKDNAAKAKTRSHVFPKSMDMGVLFLENAVKLLNDGGRMAIVLSNSIASIKEWENIRAWFLSRMRVVATIDLPTGTFGETAVATTVIVAYKPKAGSKILETDYQMFPFEIVNCGYEVKTKKRLVVFEPRFLIDETTFTEALDKDGNKMLLEDFSQLQGKFMTWAKFQEPEMREAFHV